jgi:RHH-type transcriptional regulator, proline utilization regulon repressor / proline dehydrogenase / delta 1-pyrroline-5-carboxylate dehydrogenase
MEKTLDEKIQLLGKRIFEVASREYLSRNKLKEWEIEVIKWCMSDEVVKTRVLSFVDVLPSLDSNQKIIAHMKEYFPHPNDRMPLTLRMGRALVTPSLITGGAAAHAIRWAVRQIALHFIAAEDLDSVVEVLQKMDEEGAAFSIDLLGEAVTSEKEADHYMSRVLEIIGSLAQSFPETHAPNSPARPRVNVSIKPTALYSQFSPLDTESTIHFVKQRLSKILRKAKSHGAFINLDMEQHEYRDLTLDIYRSILSDQEFSDYPHIGVAFQTYYTDSEKVLLDILEWASKRPTPINLRLIKGAYWDQEIIKHKQNNWPVPVFTNKHETDLAFERCVDTVLQNHRVAHLAIGTHNIRSIAFTIARANELGLPKSAVEYQMLYGMANPTKKAVLDLGLPVRMYTPFGALIPGMGYLVRRILENTSNESFLRQGFLEKSVDLGALLKNPARLISSSPKPKIIQEEDAPEDKDIRAFCNEPLTDFSIKTKRREMKETLRRIHHSFPKDIPFDIGGRPVQTEFKLVSNNPADPNEIIAYVAQARPQDVDLAIQVAHKARPAWEARGTKARAELLFATADLMRQERYGLAALEVLEVGKNWVEADADVCEAIDFLEYYGREAIRISKRHPIQQVLGETNRLVWRGLGVGCVIAPWNFPLAILTGMTSAGLVTGNGVMMKPAEQSPLIAYRLLTLFRKAGVPKEILTLLPGTGEGVGDTLVRHPEIQFIAFTGSKEVGLGIRAIAAQPPEGTHTLKRIITEMGGKNAIIVDSDADLDEAILGVVRSTFGFQGQKCSACSRVIVLDDVYDLFLSRLTEATKSLYIGKPEKPSTFIGPLIDDAALEKARHYIRLGTERHKTAYQYPQESLPHEGYFVGPTIFREVPPDSPLAQDEIFAPILSVMCAKNFKEAIHIANQTVFALTGGIYSRSPKHIEEAKQSFEVGNLYINRTITGAIVGRQPFGGFKLSGGGTKAGGPGYLEEFLLKQTISENTLRHGFTPV